MKNKRLFSLLLLLLCGLVSAAQSDQLVFSKIPLTTTFNTSDYNGGIQNWAISQNDQGFIYLANNFGLFEFDGENWRKNEVPENTRLRSLYINANSRIYVGGQNQFGFFEPDRNNQLIFHSLRHLLPDSSQNLEDIWSIIQYDNSILFCSYDGVFAYQSDSLIQYNTPGQNERTFLASDKLFLSSVNYGLGVIRNNEYQPISGSEFLIGNVITAILPHQNNSYLILLENGMIYNFKDDAFTKWTSSASEFLKDSGINTALLLRNKDIAIGTQNNGVVILSPTGEVKLHLTKNKGLSHRTVLSLYQDRCDNLWVGLNNGLSMVELSSPFSIIDEQLGLPGTGYCALIHDDIIYLGTSNGLFFQSKSPNPIKDDVFKMVKNTSGQVYSLKEINGQLFLGHHNGAYVVEGDHATNIYNETGVWDFANVPKSNKVMAGTYEGFVIGDLSQTNIKFQKIKGFDESSRVFHIQEDSSVFMAHGYKGVYKLDIDYENYLVSDQKFYGENAGFPADRLINLYQVGDDLLFPALVGIYSYDEQSDSFIHNDQYESYLSPDVHISELEYDYDGSIFFMSDEELGYLKKNNFGEYEKFSSEFVKIRKYLSDDFENITALDHRNIVLGAKEGFIHYNPIIPHIRDDKFEVFIRKVVSITEDEQLDYGGTGKAQSGGGKSKYNYPANFRSLKFTFATPYYNDQEGIRYQYRLDNFEDDWSKPSSVNEKEYTNLSQGNYTFKVRAINIYGDISEPATYTFSVFPPWYKSNLAYAFYVFTLLLVFGILMYLQSARYKQDRKKLAQNQQKELERKDSEIQEVSKISENQIAKLKNDKLRLEIDHKNRELATTTMHLINKNEFMLSVRETMQEIAKSGTKNGIKKLIKDIDKNLAEDEGWDQFTKHFDQVHGDFLKKIRHDHPTLTPQEIKLCAYLRMNMSSKEIANLLNISVRGVEIGRYRLRKKLNISRETNLVDFMMGYTS